MKRSLSRFFYVGQSYRDEFRKQTRMIITFTLGFTIAFTWREVLFEASKSFVKWLTKTENSGMWGGAIFITFICLILMFGSSRWLKRKTPHM